MGPTPPRPETVRSLPDFDPKVAIRQFPADPKYPAPCLVPHRHGHRALAFSLLPHANRLTRPAFRA
jgi:hypothetical protein